MSGQVENARRTSADTRRQPDLSVIIPLFNEDENVPILCEQLFSVLKTLPQCSEVVVVNDGSTDATLQRLRDAVALYPSLKVINFRRNYGQTAALMAGIDRSSGEIIVALDGDLQNDPRDIPRLLAKLGEGFDVVSSWRQNRHEPFLRRVVLSRAANKLISWISGVRLNDYGCTLKAYRRDVIKDVRLYGEMHRFVPIYATWMGAKVAEIPVKQHPRRYGRSKYGLERIVKVLLDMILMKFLDRYWLKPIYVFGGFGILSIGVSGLSFLMMLYWKLAEGVDMITTPLPLLSALTFLAGIMSILMGLLSEILVRVYFESQGRPTYLVRDLINFDASP